MKEYEDRKYEAWREQIESNLLIYLKKNLLTKPSASSATTHRSIADEGASSEDASGSLAAAVQSQGEACGHSVSKSYMLILCCIGLQSSKLPRAGGTFVQNGQSCSLENLKRTP